MSTTNPKPSLLAAVERAPTERKPRGVPAPVEARSASPSVAKGALKMGILGAGVRLATDRNKSMSLKLRAANALGAGVSSAAASAAANAAYDKMEGPVAVRFAASVAAGWAATQSVDLLTKAAGVEFGRRPYV